MFELPGMRIFICYIFIFCIVMMISCSKQDFIASAGATIVTSADTLYFDTVFTGLGSVTKSFTIVNNNNRKIKISSVELAGGNASAFSININGIAASTVLNYELEANDSMYVFVKATIDPNNEKNPFLLLGSLRIHFNGSSKTVYLKAYGQNANFVKEGIISSNTVWNNNLPYVIEKGISIAEGTTLTIEKGTRIFINARAAFIINGTLICNGGKDDSDRITFSGDRLDDVYKNLPASWPGLVFSTLSAGNKLVYTNLVNAYQALVTEGGANNSTPKILMEQCTISNAYDVGIYAVNTSIIAANCLISQVGNAAITGVGGSNILIAGGGNYNFTHCTIATYANYYQQHKQPVVFISNKSNGFSANLNAAFVNSIIYGEGGDAQNELIVDKSSTDNVSFTNCLYKVKDAGPNATFTDCIKNIDPLFDSINTNLQWYNFRLRQSSPGIDAGKATGIMTDLDGAPRPSGTKPDLGCYEKQ